MESGEGKNIKIYTDNWAPRPTTFKLVSPLVTHNRMTVDSLFSSPRIWNESLIDQTFIPYDADLIKAIPFSNDANADSRYWFYDNRGNYTMKSGYIVAVADKLKGHASTSHSYADWW